MTLGNIQVMRTGEYLSDVDIGHYKTEEVYRTSYPTLAEGQVGWSLYRIWYEAERVHESLGYQTPHERLAVVPRT